MWSWLMAPAPWWGALVAMLAPAPIGLGAWLLVAELTHRRGMRAASAAHRCPHRGPDGGQDALCARYGCPDDPAWHGDGCR